jgi:hypothetical protein
MATKDERFPKRFLSADDLKGKPIRLEIKREYLEELADTTGKKRNKSILAFAGTTKELVLNVTNWEKIAEITGEYDSENWQGRKVELYPTTTEMAGKTVDCIRIRAPAQKEMKLKKSAPAPKAPEAEPDDADAVDPDFDDEIPFK